MRDLYNNIGVVQAIAPQVQTGNLTSSAIDLTNYDQAVCHINTGAIVASGNVTPKLTECATSGGTYTDVAASDLNGSFPSALAANTAYKVGYIGTKPFIKVVLTLNSGTSVAVSATIVTARPGRRPIP